MFSKRFIFSERKSDRIKRHLLFWLFYWFYFTFLHAANSGGKSEINYFRNIPYATVEAFSLLIPQVLITYTLISFVLPKYLLKKRYFISFLWISFFVVVAAFMNYVMLTHINPALVEFLLPEKYIVRNPRMLPAIFYLALIVSFKGTLVVATAACSIKLMKYWHLEATRNLELHKEKTEAQLKLLTAQVHPHFLFNTLNNIYSLVQNESPKGSKMVMELSDLLRYILSEGNKISVPLSKELMMMKEYINLEKVRYGNKLDLHVAVPAETGYLQISPLLLLPFLENCFKHGASNFLNNPWVNLKIELNGSTMLMKLMNGKDTVSTNEKVKSGTGIENVKKRLELLYRDNYELQIIDEPEVYIVNVTIELAQDRHQSRSQTETSSIMDYA